MKKIVIIFIILLSSCETSKKATKNKTQEKTSVKTSKTEAIKTFDFSTVDTESQEFTFKPNDNTKFMNIVTHKGDTIKAKNTNITRKRVKSKVSNNISKKETKALEDNFVKESTEVKKTSNKQESFNPQKIIYALAFIALILLILIIVVSYMYLRLKKDIPNLITNSFIDALK